MPEIARPKLRYEEQTRFLHRLLFDVQNELRIGWSENVYHEAVVALARERSIPVVSKPRFTLAHQNLAVHTFECDLIAWNLIILELKVLPHDTFTDSHFAQIISYLKCWKMGLGLLVNFGPLRLQTQRVIWNEPELVIAENLDAFMPHYSNKLETINRIQDTIKRVGLQYGLGFPESVYRDIVAIELNSKGVTCTQAIEIPATINGHIIHNEATGYLRVSDSILVNIRGLLDYPSKYDFAQMKTFLNQLGLKSGIIANFGKKQLQLFGVSAA